MKHYLFYIAAATLFAVWAIATYSGDMPGNFANILPVLALGIIFYKLMTTEPGEERRRGFRP